MDIPVRRKPGTPSKGKREPITTRVPEEQRSVYTQRAHELGIPVSSWVAKVLAEHEGLEIPDYVLKELEKAERERAFQAAEEYDYPQSA